MRRIVAYTFLNVCEKIYQFLSSIKRCTQKKVGSCFFLPHSVYTTYIRHVFQIVGVI